MWNSEVSNGHFLAMEMIPSSPTNLSNIHSNLFNQHWEDWICENMIVIFQHIEDSEDSPVNSVLTTVDVGCRHHSTTSQVNDNTAIIGQLLSKVTLYFVVSPLYPFVSAWRRYTTLLKKSPKSHKFAHRIPPHQLELILLFPLKAWVNVLVPGVLQVLYNIHRHSFALTSDQSDAAPEYLPHIGDRWWSKPFHPC